MSRCGSLCAFSAVRTLRAFATNARALHCRASLLAIVLALACMPAVCNAQAPRTSDPYSIDNLISLGIVPKPTTENELRNIYQIVGEQRMQMAQQTAGTAPSGVPSRYVNLANQQATLFSIKWAYREQSDPGFYQSAEYWRDRQLLSQGCFPTCPPDDPAERNRSSQVPDPRAVLNQLRAMANADLSGLLSPRRLDALAADQEGRQLEADVPDVIDFTDPDRLEDSALLDAPLIDMDDENVFPPWESDPNVGTDSAASCLTLDGCLEAAQRRDLSNPDPSGPGSPDPGPSDLNDSPLNPVVSALVDAADLVTSDAHAGEIGEAGRRVADGVREGYEYLREKTTEGLNAARQLTHDTANAMVDRFDDFAMGKLDATGRFTGLVQRTMGQFAAAGIPDTSSGGRTVFGEFLTGFLASKTVDAANRVADAGALQVLGANDAYSRLRFSFQRDIGLNVAMLSPKKLVDGFEKFFGIAKEVDDQDLVELRR